MPGYGMYRGLESALNCWKSSQPTQNKSMEKAGFNFYPFPLIANPHGTAISQCKSTTSEYFVLTLKIHKVSRISVSFFLQK